MSTTSRLALLASAATLALLVGLVPMTSVGATTPTPQVARPHLTTLPQPVPARAAARSARSR